MYFLTFILADLSAKLRASDVVVSEAPVIGKHFDDLKQVKWVHSIWAGKCLPSDHFVFVARWNSIGSYDVDSMQI